MGCKAGKTSQLVGAQIGHDECFALVPFHNDWAFCRDSKDVGLG